MAWIKVDSHFIRRTALLRQGPPHAHIVYLFAVAEQARRPRNVIYREHFELDVTNALFGGSRAKVEIKRTVDYLLSVGLLAWVDDERGRYEEIVVAQDYLVESNVEPNDRRELPGWMREAILRRDDYHCRECGRGPEDGAFLEIDHIHPWSRGGDSDEHNLQVLCGSCNASKGAR